MGMAPIGGLAFGALAGWIGAPLTVAFGAAGTILAGIWFSRQLPQIRRLIRPIYERLGIIPEVATAMQTATELRPR
jgi:hypothetical protein